jgi:hypothetical protein
MPVLVQQSPHFIQQITVGRQCWRLKSDTSTLLAGVLVVAIGAAVHSFAIASATKLRLELVPNLFRPRKSINRIARFDVALVTERR